MLKKKEECAECRRLRKMLQNADEREKLLTKGVDYLLGELWKLSGKRRVARRMYKRKAI